MLFVDFFFVFVVVVERNSFRPDQPNSTESSQTIEHICIFRIVQLLLLDEMQQAIVSTIIVKEKTVTAARSSSATAVAVAVAATTIL